MYRYEMGLPELSRTCPEAIAWERFSAELLAMYDPAAGASSPKTARKLRQVLREIGGLGVETTAGLTPATVAAFLGAHPERASATRRSLLMSLRLVCSYAEARRYIDVSPFRIRRLSRWVRAEPPAGKRHNTAAEIRVVLDLMGRDVVEKRGWAQWRARRLLALTALVAYTGLRAGEAQRLWVDDIELDAHVLHVRPHGKRLKTEGSAQDVALPAAAIPFIREWLAHRLDRPEGFPAPDDCPWFCPGSRRLGPWSQGPPGYRPADRLGAVARRAGVPDMTFQMLRKSWATLAEQKGIPQALITRQCRHSTEQTTKVWYQQRDLDALKGAVEGFDF